MYDNKRIVAIIPARGGSKGIPGKNIRELCGKPLISWTLNAALASSFLDRTIISTDSPEIAGVARSWGGEVPFLRPVELATDKAPSSETVKHALTWLNSNDAAYDAFVLLQPTSPLRTSDHIDRAIASFFSDPGTVSLVSVCQTHQSPYIMKRMGQDGFVTDFMGEAQGAQRRQDMPTLYVLNGAIYISGVNSYLRSPTFNTTRTKGFSMDIQSSVDIDEEDDLLIAEAFLRRRVAHP